MRLLVGVLLLAFAIPGRRASAEEKHFALFFAYQNYAGQPMSTHSFIEFIRADVQPNAPPTILQRDTISWMADDGKVRLLSIRAEQGRNASLDETLALATGRRVSAWGPYELTPCAYSMAMNRKAELESGAIGYKAAVVLPGKGRRLANCVHAAGEIDPADGRVARFELQFGDNATRQLVRHYARRGYLCSPHCPRDDVFSALGLDGRCIRRLNDWDQHALGRMLSR